MVLSVEVGLGPGDFALDGDRAPLPKRGRSPLPNFRPISIVAKTAGCIKMPLGMELGLGPDDIVLDWDPPQKGGRAPSPIFGPCLLSPNCWMDQGDTCHGGGPWSRPHCARWGHSCPPPKKGQSPQFLAHVYCGQTAGWIKTSLGTEVDLGPGHFVLGGFQAIGERGTAAPSFLLLILSYNKSSAVAEMGDRGHNRHCGNGRPYLLLLSS